MRPSGIVTLLTDYGLVDPYVGILKGAALRANPRIQLVDLGHDVPAQDIAAGAFAWSAAIGWFPAGTVHLAVVDPGVGTARRLVAASAHGCYWLAPDNGLLSPVLATAAAADVRVIDTAHLGLTAASRTFHGRDLLAPVAAWLAAGRYSFAALGPRISDPIIALPGAAGESASGGRIVHVDRFGNLITNVGGDRVSRIRAVTAGGRRIPVAGTYAEVPAGGLLALVGSFGLLEIAVHGGSAAAVLGIGRGAAIDLSESA